MSNLTLATRHWDHVIPLALGDVPDSNFMKLERRDVTPTLWSERALDGGETSLSMYLRKRDEGDESVIALPIFPMRGFRHRCIITRRDAHFETASDLHGATIGLTGWGDTGNTWTRAILRDAGVHIQDAAWQVGRLTADHPITDRIAGANAPSNVTACPNDEPMTDLLERGRLDAIMTPFMPPGFYAVDSPFRTLYRDTQSVEANYFAAKGYIPGIHLLAVQARVLDDDPRYAEVITNAFEQSRILSAQRRAKLLDVTPWQNQAHATATIHFGDNWMPSGWIENAAMVADLQTEMLEQGLIRNRIPLEDLFPFRPEPSAVFV